MSKFYLIILLGACCLCPLIGCQGKPVSNEVQSVVLKNDTIASQEEQSKENNCLIGKWFMPHIADINITFYQNRTFIFNDFNSKTETMEVLKGTFELNGENLILRYNDRQQQIFKLKKGKGADDNYYITKGKNYYFVKSDIDN